MSKSADILNAETALAELHAKVIVSSHAYKILQSRIIGDVIAESSIGGGKPLAETAAKRVATADKSYEEAVAAYAATVKSYDLQKAIVDNLKREYEEINGKEESKA